MRFFSLMTLKFVSICFLFIVCYFSTTKDTKNTKVLKDEASDTILQPDDVEVYQQTNPDCSQLHVCQQLRLVDPFELFNALEFDDQFILYQQVHPVSAIKLYPLILNGLWVLKLELYLIKTQFMCKTLFICGLQQSRPQLPVDFNCTSDHLI